MQKGRESPQKKSVKMNADLQNNNKGVHAFKPASPVLEIPTDTLYISSAPTPDPFSGLLCPDLCQESNHSSHLSPLPSGPCGWVWLMGGTGRKFQSKRRVAEVLFHFGFFPAPSTLWCCVSGHIQLLLGGPSWAPQHPQMAAYPGQATVKSPQSLLVRTFWVSQLLPSRADWCRFKFQISPKYCL